MRKILLSALAYLVFLSGSLLANEVNILAQDITTQMYNFMKNLQQNWN